MDVNFGSTFCNTNIWIHKLLNKFWIETVRDLCLELYKTLSKQMLKVDIKTLFFKVWIDWKTWLDTFPAWKLINNLIKHIPLLDFNVSQMKSLRKTWSDDFLFWNTMAVRYHELLIQYIKSNVDININSSSRIGQSIKWNSYGFFLGTWKQWPTNKQNTSYTCKD